MAELKLTKNPCKYCNGEIDEGKRIGKTLNVCILSKSTTARFAVGN